MATAKDWILREFSIANPTPARRITPPWNVYMGKFDPAERGQLALAGHPSYCDVNVIN